DGDAARSDVARGRINLRLARPGLFCGPGPGGTEFGPTTPALGTAHQPPRLRVMSNTPPGTRPPHHPTELRARACFAAGGRAETGLGALRRDSRVAPEAHRAERAGTPGPARAQSVAPPPRR